jgi:hypothetical protein
MAVDARYRVGHQLLRFGERHFADLFKAFLNLRFTMLFPLRRARFQSRSDVGGNHGPVTLQAGPRLLELVDAFGFALVA